jgi:ubiquinone/menaquinone biosynthesis C-methylase UbiE
VSLWNVEDYVRLRHGGDDAALELLAKRHITPGTEVVEIGCGPGRAAAALAERHGAHVTAVDASPEMLEAARAIVPPSVELVEAHAERLPLGDAAFDVAFSNFAVHLFDRARAFAEVRRILRPDGIYWIKTADPDGFSDHWAATLFPSFVEIELERFPGEPALRSDLERAGFADVIVERLERVEELSRDEIVEHIRAGTFSTWSLLPPQERAEGIARATELLDDPVRRTATLLVVAATT